MAMACLRVGATTAMSMSMSSSFLAPMPLRNRVRISRASAGPLLRVVAQQSSEASEVGALGTAVIAGGLVANPVVAWSLYTLKTTGCGLPPGPGGLIGAVEGVSYLVILGTIGWSTYTKVRQLTLSFSANAAQEDC